MSKLLRIGGKDYATGLAHAANVNSGGELGFANTIGQLTVVEEQSLGAQESVEVTLTDNDIPKGTTYIGYFLGKNSDSVILSLTIDSAEGNSFSRFVRFNSKTIDFGYPRENYAILPRGSADGHTRITLKNRGGGTGTVQLWVVFYRTGSPIVVGEAEKDVWEEIRTFEATVEAFSSVSAIGSANTSKYREVIITARTNSIHEFSINSLLSSESLPLVPRGVHLVIASDVFQAPASGALAPEIINHSSNERTYTITFKGRK